MTSGLIRYFTGDELRSVGPFTDGFTDPFRYTPHPLVQIAAGQVMERIDTSDEFRDAFSEGKMLGVLIVREGCRTGYLAAFSGNVGGRNLIEGFVPPVFDLLDPSGTFKKREAEITALGHRITAMQQSDTIVGLRNELAALERQRDEELGLVKARMAASKREREARRHEDPDDDVLAGLIRESQFEKAELRRLRSGWEERIAGVRERITLAMNEISSLKALRAEMSDELQKWIFRQFIVHNLLGEQASIDEIFAARELIPPGGSGECAAPKLLEHAWRNGLHPLAMGEFWYGNSPDTAVRTHGHFYPSCTSRCAPLLGFMLKGLELSEECRNVPDPVVIHEDEAIIVAVKPSGMPSVPGLDGKLSVQEWLSDRFFMHTPPVIHAVHRLDMDTSGVMVFAKTAEAAVNLRRQFEVHSIDKTYIARLSAPDPQIHSGISVPELRPGSKGTISLPLSPDYDERPRQKADRSHGKDAVTHYEVAAINNDGTADIIFRPVTGRTHQLRVHAAHVLGLGRPIVGDLLYGGYSIFSPSAAPSCHDAPRLCLHALSLSFIHPVSGDKVRFSCETFLNFSNNP